MQRNHALWYWLLAGIALMVFAFFPKWTVDDAFISYRYGQNLASFGELNWNPGTDPVEGYTGIFLPLLAALFLKTGLPLLTGIKVLGVMAFFGSGYLIRAILKQLNTNETSVLVVLSLWILTPFLYLHSLGGLETPFFILFCLAFWWSVLRAHQKNTFGADALMSSLALLAALCRPEGLLLLPGAAFCFILNKNRSWRRLLAFSLFFLLPAALYFAWRWQYYGHFFPNTFAVKEYPGFINPDSFWSFAKFAVVFAALPLFIAGLSVFFQRRTLQKTAKEGGVSHEVGGIKVLMVSILAFAVLLIALYLHSHLYMNVSYRFWAPLYPVLLLLTGLGLHWGKESFIQKKGSRNFRARGMKYSVWVVVCLQLLLFVRQWKKDIHFASYYQSIVEDEYEKAADFIKTNVPSEEKLIVYLDAGAVPFYTGLQTIDFGDLNDEYLAREKPDASERIEYFFSHNAGVLVFTSEKEEEYSYLPGAHGILEDSRFAENYQLVRKFENGFGFPYYQFIFLRKDLIGDI